MPDAQGRPLAGEPGYVAPAPPDPNTSVPGLINDTPGLSTVTPGQPVTSYTPAQADAVQATSQGYTPNAFTVSPDQTVAGQIKGLIDDDSPLMQQAKTRALQDQNARGTLNSSMAIGAAHNAVMDKALPIAQQDATTHANAHVRTVDAQNAALNFEASQANEVARLNANLGTNANLANAQAINQAFTTAVNNATQLAGIRLNNENQLALQSLDLQSKMALATLDAQNRQLMQTNQSASNAYVQAVTNITNISMSNQMSQEAKDRAISSQLNLLNEQFKALSGIASTAPAAVENLDLSQYFIPVEPGTTGGTSGSPTTASQGLASDIPITNPVILDWQAGRLEGLEIYKMVVEMEKARAGDTSLQRQLEAAGIPWWQESIDLTDTETNARTVASRLGQPVLSF